MLPHYGTWFIDSFVFQPQTVDRNKDPANPNIPASANLNDRRNGDGGEGHSQLLQQTAASETRENGNSEQNSNANSEGIDNTLVSPEALGEF